MCISTQSFMPCACSEWRAGVRLSILYRKSKGKRTPGNSARPSEDEVCCGCVRMQCLSLIG